MWERTAAFAGNSEAKMKSDIETVYEGPGGATEAADAGWRDQEIGEVVALLSAILAGFDRATAHHIARALLTVQKSPSDRDDKPRYDLDRWREHWFLKQLESSPSALRGPERLSLAQESSQESSNERRSESPPPVVESSTESQFAPLPSAEKRSQRIGAVRKIAKRLSGLFDTSDAVERSDYLDLLSQLVLHLPKPQRASLIEHAYFAGLLLGDTRKDKLVTVRRVIEAADFGGEDLRSLAKHVIAGLLSETGDDESAAGHEEKRGAIAARLAPFIRALIDSMPRGDRELLYLDLAPDLAGVLARPSFKHPAVATFPRDDRYAYQPAYFGHGGRKSPLLWDVPGFGDLATATIREGDSSLSYDRLFVLYTAFNEAIRRERRPGAGVVEIGVYKGGTAKFLAELTSRREDLRLSVDAFDTFAGHDAEDVTELDYHEAGRFGDASAEYVITKLASYPNARVHVGRAQDNFDKIPSRLALAHLDTDLYEPTRDCLPLLFDRLTPGGSIIVDDFGARSCPGVERAVLEFVNDRPNAYVFGLQTGQCLIVGGQWRRSPFSLSFVTRFFSKILPRS